MAHPEEREQPDSEQPEQTTTESGTTESDNPDPNKTAPKKTDSVKTDQVYEYASRSTSELLSGVADALSKAFDAFQTELTKSETEKQDVFGDFVAGMLAGQAKFFKVIGETSDRMYARWKEHPGADTGSQTGNRIVILNCDAATLAEITAFLEARKKGDVLRSSQPGSTPQNTPIITDLSSREAGGSTPAPSTHDV